MKYLVLSLLAFTYVNAMYVDSSIDKATEFKIDDTPKDARRSIAGKSKTSQSKKNSKKKRKVASPEAASDITNSSGIKFWKY
ncbi:MAG: hypothetical protein N4A33_02575 [Bacteriovoracaceae bacterium]|jgi:hypothetical protein|nr:hypothetical protein [Bacteriovoracaceae bacterium]